MLRALGLKGEGDGRGRHPFRHCGAIRLFYVDGMRIKDIGPVGGHDRYDPAKLPAPHAADAQREGGAGDGMGRMSA
jgi:hypothetical protein